MNAFLRAHTLVDSIVKVKDSVWSGICALIDSNIKLIDMTFRPRLC
jgi:hypothetical protein